MIWIFIFFLMFFSNAKDFMFTSMFMFVDDASCFMMSVAPLVLVIVVSTLFNFFGPKEYVTYIFMFTVNIMLVALCFLMDSSMFYLAILESTVYFMAFLILNFSKDSDKLSSMFLMFSMNMVGSILFMMFSSKMLKLYMLDSFTMNFLNGNQISSIFVWLTFLVIFLTKLPLMFFHFWLTKAHVSASGACSMLLASLMLKLGSFGLFKFSMMFLILATMTMNIILSISIFSCLIFSIVMMRFFDLKYMVACSSILHMSLMYPLSSHFSSMSILGSLYMMVAHGLVSYYMFFLVTLMYESSFNRSMDFNKSLESTLKNLMMFTAVFVLLNLGVPPFINFLSELILCSSLQSISIIALTTFMMSMVITIMFSMFITTKMMFGKKNLMMDIGTGESINLYSTVFMLVMLIMPPIFS